MKELTLVKFSHFAQARSLTLREREVLEQMLTCLSQKEIADCLHISIRTVKFHAVQIYSKLGVSGRVELQDFMRQQRDESLSDWNRLTPMQRNIVRIIAKHGSKQTVLKTISLSASALNMQLKIIYQILRVSGIIQLVIFVFKNKLDQEALEVMPNQRKDTLMKMLVVLLLFLFSIPAIAGTVSQDCGAVTTCSMSIPAAGGDLVVVAVRAGKLPTISIPGFQLAGFVDSSDPHRLAIFYQYAAGTGSVAVSVNAPGASTLRLTGSSFAGPWDSTKAPTFTSAAGSSVTANSGRCPAADLCIGGASTGNPDSIAVVTNESLITSVASKLFLLSGTTATNVTLSATDLWAAAVAGFVRPITPPSGDTTPPTVSINSISNGQIISGITTVSVMATDDTAVASVQPLLDGIKFGPALTTAPYIFTIDTATQGVGQHTVGAIATDTSSNSATASISVTVAGELFDIILAYDDATPFAPGGSIALSEQIQGSQSTQSDGLTSVSSTGEAKFRWPATPSVVYLVVVRDSSGAVVWQTPTQLTPSQMPTAFTGVNITTTFTKATNAFLDIKAHINY